MSAQPRALTAADLPGLAQVQRACYGDGLAESTEVFARRLASPANCSLVIAQGGRVLAYLAAYRSLLAKVTPLHGDFEPAPTPDTLYLHDLAVASRHKLAVTPVELAVVHAPAAEAERLRLAADDLAGVGRIAVLRIEAADVESVAVGEIRLAPTEAAG
mgnify:CR=1 FL=1